MHASSARLFFCFFFSLPFVCLSCLQISTIDRTRGAAAATKPANEDDDDMETAGGWLVAHMGREEKKLYPEYLSVLSTNVYFSLFYFFFFFFGVLCM